MRESAERAVNAARRARRLASGRSGARRARARGFDDGRDRASRSRAFRGGGPGRFPVGRRARPPPRRRGLARGCGALSRPVRERRRACPPRAGRGACYRARGALSHPGPDPGRGVARARQAGRGRRTAGRRDRGGAPAGQHARVGVEPLESLCRRTHGRGRGARARRPLRRASTSARISTTLSSRPGRRSGSPVPYSRPGNRNVRSSCCSAPPAARSSSLIAGGRRAHCLELLTR